VNDTAEPAPAAGVNRKDPFEFRVTVPFDGCVTMVAVVKPAGARSFVRMFVAVETKGVDGVGEKPP
jgi:hypothetical protein